MGVSLPLSRIIWKPSWRIVPSHFPTIPLFERVAGPADLEAVFELEALTNPSIAQSVGNLSLVASRDRVSGIGSSVIMAPFTHLNPNGSRFSDGTYGVYYAAEEMATAIAETCYHRARFMRATRQPRMEFDMRVYQADLDSELHDLRKQLLRHPLVYDPDNYAAGRSLAASLRSAGSSGIAYDSVRMEGGECAALFRPSVLSNARQERHLCYVWDGVQIASIYEKREVHQD